MKNKRSAITLSLSLAGVMAFNVAKAQEIGLQLYSVREQLKTDVSGTFDKIHSWKIKEVEGGDTYGMTSSQYLDFLKSKDLKLVSISADYKDLTDNPQAVADKAKALGVKSVVCFWVYHNGDDFGIEDIKGAANVFNKAGRVLKENGIDFCYHPHGYEFRPYEQGTLFDYLVKNTNPEYLNFEMDVFWVKHPGQDPVALLKKYPNRFKMLHLKDRKPGTPGNQNGKAPDESNVVLGQGDVGIAAIMKEAKKIGIKYYFIEDESPSSMEQIPRSLEYLHTLK